MFEPEEFAQATPAIMVAPIKKIKNARPVYVISAKV
jgi:hypothetical protein